MLSKLAFNADDLHQKITDALAYAKAAGADAAQASISSENGFSVNARQGDVETLEHHQEKELDITVYWRQQTASANTSDLSMAAIRATIDKACAIARYASPDPFAGLADPDLMAYHYPDLQLHHPWDITPNAAIEMAIECENIACQQDPRLRPADGASVGTYQSLMIYGNSHGFIGMYPTSIHMISCGVVAAENEQMQRDHDYTTARRASDLDSVVFVAKQVAQKTLARLGARPIKTRQCPIIFYAPAARSLLRSFVSAISGSQLYRQDSFLQDCLGKPVFPKQVHIFQQPHLLSAVGSAPFDSEGVVTHNLDYVNEGVLTQYVLGSYSARKLGLATTGNAGGVFNLEINHQGHNLTELLRQMDKGLLVTELLGQGVNMTTGDYSRGASGFWIENGEIQFPVEQVTIAGNLKDMFANFVAVANDFDCRGSIRTGSILIREMTVAGS